MRVPGDRHPRKMSDRLPWRRLWRYIDCPPAAAHRHTHLRSALRRPGGLAARLSEFDREQFFTLTSADVAAIREQLRSDHRLPAGLMLMFMRVAGRPLDGFNVLPRNLLRHTAQDLAVTPPSIAYLHSIYKRRQTLSKHQL